MKKPTLFKAMLLLCSFAASIESAWADTYVKVTSTSDLVAGDVYIIGSRSVIAKAYDKSTECLATTNTGFTYTESSGTITTDTANPMEFILGETTNGHYTFKNGTYYLGYAATSNQTYLRFSQKASSSKQEQWTITNKIKNTTYEFFAILSVHTPDRFIGNSNGLAPTNGDYRAYDKLNTNPPATLYKKVVTAEISDAGWKTYAPAFPVRFREGINAYIVRDANSSVATLQKVTSVPAGTPVLLEGTEGSTTSTTMDVVASSDTNVEGNMLKMSAGDVNGDNIYVLANVDNVVGFYRWNGNAADLNGKIYLSLSSGARPFIALPGEETGIGALLMNDEQSSMNNIFDLQGRRVAQPSKGVYIVNGKKVIKN